MSGWCGRSPVTVQEWVAALPPLEDHGRDHPDDSMAHSEDTEHAGEEDKESAEDKMDESSDNIKLGEEGGDFRFHIMDIVIQIQIFVWWLFDILSIIIAAGYFVTEGVKSFGQLLLQKNNKNIR